MPVPVDEGSPPVGQESAEPPTPAFSVMPGERISFAGGTRPDVPMDSGFCTSAQIRRFIKSRPYVPMHELRRRFELNGGADDVTAIPTPDGLVYLGLPHRESHFIADLVRQGDVGLELCNDPYTPMVMGLFAIRPITRP